MKKIRMCFPREKTFEDGFKEYILDCKARNLREGTIHHYQESIKQIYKRIPPDTPISSMNKQTKGVSWENIETLCRLLECQPADLMEYVDVQE